MTSSRSHSRSTGITTAHLRWYGGKSWKSQEVAKRSLRCCGHHGKGGTRSGGGRAEAGAKREEKDAGTEAGLAEAQRSGEWALLKVHGIRA